MNAKTPTTSSATSSAEYAALSDDDIECMLREDAALAADVYIDNDGFCERVMQDIAKLPVPRGLSATHRVSIIAATSIAGLLFVILAGHGGDYLIDAVMDLVTETITPTLLGITLLVFLGAVLAINAAADAR